MPRPSPTVAATPVGGAATAAATDITTARRRARIIGRDYNVKGHRSRDPRGWGTPVRARGRGGPAGGLSRALVQDGAGAGAGPAQGRAARELSDAAADVVVGAQHLHPGQHPEEPIVVTGPLVDGAQIVEQAHQYVALAGGIE